MVLSKNDILIFCFWASRLELDFSFLGISPRVGFFIFGHIASSWIFLLDKNIGRRAQNQNISFDILNDRAVFNTGHRERERENTEQRENTVHSRRGASVA